MIRTTFYSHPLDNLFMLLSATVLPMYMLTHGWVVSTPTITIYGYMSLVIFISSHHVISVDDKEIKGTPHMMHHIKNRVNYSNFLWLDDWLGTKDECKSSTKYSN